MTDHTAENGAIPQHPHGPSQPSGWDEDCEICNPTCHHAECCTYLLCAHPKCCGYPIASLTSGEA